MKKEFSTLKNPIFVALDVDDLQKIRDIVGATYDLVGGFKIGPRTIFRYGPSLVAEIAQKAPVFLDFKFYDIPSTMEASIQSAFDMGASFATIHASCGAKTLSTLANLELKLSSQRPFHILAVTILTSFDEKTLPANYEKMSIERHVDKLVQECMENGIQNFVCSPHELEMLSKYKEARFVTPGIRFDSQKSDDQNRTATAKEAIDLGASALVIGRPILQATNPREFLQRISLK